VAAGRRYTRAVTAAKFALPLIALGLLSALVLLARNAPEGEPLRFVDRDVEELARTQRLGTPRYAAVTDDGGELSITADVFVPDPERAHVTLGENLTATMRMPDGVVYDATADNGELDEPALRSTLTDNVVVVSSDGAVLRTEALRMRNDRSYMETLAPVRIDGPQWWVEADRMEVFTDPEDEMRTRMVFTGGVRLLYTP
jgi:lipopolysaccharide export system protein LptC